MKTAIILPTCRPEAFAAWIAAWRPHFGAHDELIVVEDARARTIDTQGAQHYSHAEIRDLLGDAAWIISKKDAAIRCFGFVIAWRGGYDQIVTFDDDCFPTTSWAGQTIGEAYELAMRHRGWQESVPGLRTRGIPYADRGELQTFLHMGLWSNVPDRDAVGELAAMAKGERLGGFIPPEGRRVVNDRQYFPLCTMNLAFRRELAPALYFPLMGEGQPYGRFDDIWGGLIAQRICRHLRMPISIGEPHIEHRRASDPFVNLKKEAPGIAAHERLWRVIEACDLGGGDPVECVQEISRQLSHDQDEYTRTLGQALGVWASLFQDSPQRREPVRHRIDAPALVGASDGRGR